MTPADSVLRLRGVSVVRAELGIPATTLIRQWITERASTPTMPAVVSVADLQRFIAEQAHPLAS